MSHWLLVAAVLGVVGWLWRSRGGSTGWSSEWHRDLERAEGRRGWDGVCWKGPYKP